MRKIFVGLFCLITSISFAQQDAELRNILVNPYYYNASYAGEDGITSLTSGARLGSGSPGFNSTSVFLMYQSPINDQPAGIGFMLNYDKGVTFDLNSLKAGLALNYKHELAEESYLRIGAQLNGFYLKDYSPETLDGDTTSLAIDIDFGAWFQQENLFLGLSSKNMARSKMNLSSGQLANLIRQMYIMAGYKFEVSDNLNVTPAIMMRSTERTREIFDLHTQMEIKERYYFGMTVQVSTLGINFPYALMAGVQASENIRLDAAAHLNRFTAGPFLNPIFEFSVRFGFGTPSPGSGSSNKNNQPVW